MYVVLLVLLILLLLGGGGWGYSRGWDYGPHLGGLGFVLVVVLIVLLLTGRL